MCECGVSTIPALTPAGRVVDLEHEHIWVNVGQPWPRDLYVLGVAGRTPPVIAHATPALHLLHRPGPARPAGPFRRRHRCP